MKTNKNLERLLEKFRHLETMEQTPAVKLVREKLPKLIEQYEKANKIEEKLKIIFQEYEELLDNTNESLDEIDKVLTTLLSEEKP